MRKFIFVFLFFLSASPGIAEDSKDYSKYTDPTYDDPDYAIPSPYKLTRIKKIIITKPSSKTNPNADENCAQFIITRKRVTFFFKYARTISNASWMHDYPLSYCTAEGTIQFVNGDKASWTLMRNGTAIMEIENGSFKDKLIFLHCRKCEEWDE